MENDRTFVGLHMYAWSVTGHGLNTVTGEVWQRKLTPHPTPCRWQHVLARSVCPQLPQNRRRPYRHRPARFAAPNVSWPWSNSFQAPVGDRGRGQLRRRARAGGLAVRAVDHRLRGRVGGVDVRGQDLQAGADPVGVDAAPRLPQQPGVDQARAQAPDLFRPRIGPFQLANYEMVFARIPRTTSSTCAASTALRGASSWSGSTSTWRRSSRSRPRPSSPCSSGKTYWWLTAS